MTFDHTKIELQEKFWNEKDQQSVEDWKGKKVQSYAEGGKLKDKYPERADFDAWVRCPTSSRTALQRLTSLFFWLLPAG